MTVLDHKGMPYRAPSANQDGYLDIFRGIGTGRDINAGIRYQPEQVLTMQLLTEIYNGDGIGRRIVDLAADEMTRQWMTISGEQGEAVSDVLETIDARNKLTEASIWARLYGGSAILYVVDDGLDFDVPLVPKRIKTLLGVRVYDRYAVIPESGELSSDPIKRLEGCPAYYTIQPPGSGAIHRVHESRLEIMTGMRLPERERVANQGWGASVLQGSYSNLQRYGLAHAYVVNMLRDFTQAVLSVKGLTNLIASGQEDIVRRRLQLLDHSRSILNTMVIDADGEEFTKHHSTVSGLGDVIDRFGNALSASTGYPISKLFGKQTTNLATTGEHELKNFYDFLVAERARQIDAPLEKMIRLIYQSTKGPTGGVEPEMWSVVWNELLQITELETAEVRKTIAEADQIYLENGVLLPDEVAKSRFGTGDWALYTELSDKPRVPPKSESETKPVTEEPVTEEPATEDGIREDMAPTPLYISREVLNADEIYKWADAEGIEFDPEIKLHVTVLYSRVPLDWFKLPEAYYEETPDGHLTVAAGGPRALEDFNGHLVLRFRNWRLEARHFHLREHGASHDWEEYAPHITLGSAAQTLRADFEPYQGQILLGPEIFAEIRDDHA